jgi:hypothetical protein
MCRLIAIQLRSGEIQLMMLIPDEWVDDDWSPTSQNY